MPAVMLPHWSEPPTCSDAAVVGVEPPVVVGLQEHVAELGVGDARLALEPVAHRVLGHHLVDRHVLAHVPQELEQGHALGPVPVVDQDRGGVALEVEELGQLDLDGGRCWPAGSRGRAGCARRSGHRGRPPCPWPRRPGRSGGGRTSWKRAQEQQGHEVAQVQGVRRGVEAGVDDDGTGPERLAEGVAVGVVVDEAAGLEVVEHVGVAGHGSTLPHRVAADTDHSGPRIGHPDDRAPTLVPVNGLDDPPSNGTGPAPRVEPAPPGRRRFRLGTVLALLVVAATIGMWAYLFLIADPGIPDQLEDDAFPTEAQAICTDGRGPDRRAAGGRRRGDPRGAGGHRRRGQRHPHRDGGRPAGHRPDRLARTPA